MRYITLVWHLFIITVALYIVRPVEAFYMATICACKAFVDKFVRVLLVKDGWKALGLYREAFNKFKGDQN